MRKVRVRQTNFELLRIFAMVLIIMFHFSDHGMVNISQIPISVNRIMLEFFQIGGGLGNCIFVILSGYFLCKSKFDIKKLVNFYLQVFFYSIFLGFISILLGYIEFNETNISNIIMPITKNQYWWFSIYFILYLIFPYLNKIISNLNKKDFSILISIGIMILSVFPTFFNCILWYSNLIFFILLYFIGAYIRNIKLEWFRNKKIINIGLVLSLILCLCLILYMDYLNLDVTFYVWPMYKTPIVLLSIFTFLFFENMNIKNNNIINIISKTTFGIYLIHMNPYFWKIFWQYLYKNYVFFYQNNFILISICEIITVFIICCTIELIRIKLLDEKLYITIEKKLLNKFRKKN